MCEFFSFVVNGRGKRFYFNWEQRQKELKTKEGQVIDNHDSHSEICTYYQLDCDRVNKYEYNPLTKKFQIDQMNTKDRSAHDRAWVEGLDFKTIIQVLIIDKPIVNPLNGEPKKVTTKEIELLKQWASVRASVRDLVRVSVWDLVRVSVWDSVGVAVWDSVGDSVWASVRASIWASVWASVRASVRDSVWDSVRDLVRAYISSFFDIYHDGHPFQSVIDLWESGFVPSFDGTKWRLHSGKSAEIVYEGEE